MVLGLTRTRLRPESTRVFPVRSAATGPLAQGWPAERGAILFEAPADLLGGFPGYAERGGALENATLRVTESFLLVDEGASHGFGLPINWIEGMALISLLGQENYALRVFFRDGALSRLFTIRFRTQRLPSRGTRRSLRAHEALLATGLHDRFSGVAPVEPNFTLPWDQTREFESENVIWTGRASAPIRVGAEHASSDIWLTTKSLIWGSGEGDGINRVPLPLLMDLVTTRLRDRLGTPVVYLAIGDDRTGRFELPFIFDQQTPPDRNFRERGALLVGLRSRGVPDGAPTPLWQPWRLERSVAPDLEAPPLAEEPAPAEVLIPEFLPAAYAAWPGAAELELAVTSPLRRRGRLGERAHRGSTAVETAEPGPEIVLDDPVTLEAVADPPPVELPPDPPRSAVDTDEIPVIVLADHAPMTQAGDPDDVVLAQWSPPEAEAAPAPVLDIALTQAWVSAPRTPDNDPVPVEAANVEIVQVEQTMTGQTETTDQGEAEHAIMREATEHAPASREPVAAPVDVVDARPAAPAEPWVAIRHYEAAAVGALAEVLRAIDDRVAGRPGASLSETPPTSFDQARALAELQTLQETGALDPAQARGRRERLLILGDVCVRLRTVVELHEHGYLSGAELEMKRAALTRSLSDVLIPGVR